MQKKRVRSLWYIVVFEVVIAALAALIVLWQPGGEALYVALRVAALTGFTLVYLAILSSLFLRELVHALGQPYIKVHHVLSIVALSLVTLHPLGWAAYNASVKALLPDFSSLSALLYQVGPFIWLLLLCGLLSALLRKKLKQWRIVHWLNYLAFLMAARHAWTLGSNTQTLGMRIVIVLMATSVVGAFVWKRIKMRRKPAYAAVGRTATPTKG
jgi:methionine sulfoxide reductase heme-binding subunit